MKKKLDKLKKNVIIQYSSTNTGIENKFKKIWLKKELLGKLKKENQLT